MDVVAVDVSLVCCRWPFAEIRDYPMPVIRSGDTIAIAYTSIRGYLFIFRST